MQRDIHTDVADFIAHLRYERRLSVHTIVAYHNDLKQLTLYLAETYQLETIAQLKPLHLRSWLSELKTNASSGRSLKRKIAAVNTFCRFLMTESKLKNNPARKLFLPKIDKPLPKFLEEKQTEQLQESIVFPDTFDGFTQMLIIELLYQCGLRRAELITLKEKDIQFSRKMIQVLGKGNKIRLIPLSASLVASLQKYIKLKKEIFEIPDENILTLRSGKALYPNYIYRTVRNYLGKVTTLEKKSPHVLRHTFASHLLNRGADLMSIKDLLGHQSLAATQVYTHLNIERLKEVYKNAHPKS